MGHWSMHIEGHGIHDNHDTPNDADELLRQFAAKLEAAGQQVHSVHFATGAKELVIAGEQRIWGQRDHSHVLATQPADRMLAEPVDDGKPESGTGL